MVRPHARVAELLGDYPLVAAKCDANQLDSLLEDNHAVIHAWPHRKREDRDRHSRRRVCAHRERRAHGPDLESEDQELPTCTKVL